MGIKATLAIIVIGGGATLYQASSWWERAFATLESSELSPDGCIRIDTYHPFWITPSIFHRMPHPDPTNRVALGKVWEAAVFQRAYEARTGTFLGESVVYDPVASFNIMFWNESREAGRRIVLSNGFPLLDSDRCADKETLAKLEAFYEKEREESRVRQEAWDQERKASQSADSGQ
jgi:hypothetical protein